MVDSAETAVGPRSGAPGIVLAEGEQAGLELRESGRLEPAGGPQLVHDGFERVEPLRLHLDLDPAQLHGPLPVPDDDDGLIERDLGGVDPADAQDEGPTARPDLEHLAQAVGPTIARRRRPTGPSWPSALRRAGHDLGDLEPLAQAVARGRARVLEGDLVVAAPPAGAHHEAGLGDPPVVRVEVGVGQAAWRAGQRGDRAAVIGLDRQRGQGGQPALDRAQVERVELPLDFDRVVRSPLSLPGARHRGRGYRRRAAWRLGPVLGGMPPVAARATIRCQAVVRRAMTAELPSPTDVVRAAGGTGCSPPQRRPGDRRRAPAGARGLVVPQGQTRGG